MKFQQKRMLVSLCMTCCLLMFCMIFGIYLLYLDHTFADQSFLPCIQETTLDSHLAQLKSTRAAASQCMTQHSGNLLAMMRLSGKALSILKSLFKACSACFLLMMPSHACRQNSGMLACNACSVNRLALSHEQ